ncbi:unnamed protein product [Phaedon cochleariae]|uniref:THAP-type domain-containing protein n=1 Tax=Phaedon cochleariae TaxID=80249 RepID=A0A9P0DEU6_PHACE|nr:unnamed protein product [Phaedon cochleariae]
MGKRIKECYVPACPNTSGNTEKTFIEVPRVNPRRVQWLKAANVEGRCIGRLYCCEDHFDVHKDFTNFRDHKRYGSKLIFVNMSICPSLYLDDSFSPLLVHETHKKYRRKKKSDSENDQDGPKHFQFVDVDKNTDDDKPQTTLNTFQSEEFDVQCQAQEGLIKEEPVEIDIKEEMWPMLMLESHLEPEDNELMEDQPSLISLSEDFIMEDKKISKPYTRKTRTQKVQVLEEDAGEEIESKSQQQHGCKCNCSFSNVGSSTTAPTSIQDMIDFDDPYKKAAMYFDKSQRQMSTLQVIQMSPKFYLGLPIHMMHILKSVSIQEKIFPLDLLITLTKIRLNDPFMRLSIDFGMGEARSRNVFHETVPKVAKALTNLISWSGHGNNRQFFVNIFELDADPKNRLGWFAGREKIIDKNVDPNTYTMKCLVCYSKEGAISFVSRLFPAKMADIEVIAYSEILNSVPSWAELFLLSHLNLTHKRTPEGLIYLTEYMEKNNVTASTQVFSDVMYKSVGSRMGVLYKMDEKKIKVDMIDLLNEFSILKNHSRFPRQTVVIMQDIIKIVCALINTEHLNLSS